MLAKKLNLLLLLSLSLSFFSCADDSENTGSERNEEESEVPETEGEQEEGENETENNTNVLLIIADDMGPDATPGYEIGSEKPNMPTLQSFIDNGIRFTNLWSAPTCTPTRSTILTGKYGFKTNMLKVGDVLSPTETSLQSYIKNQTNDAYAQAIIGKWHLSSSATHPAEMGVEHYEGLLSGTPIAYDNWQFTQNENTTTSNEYITTKYTDLAIDWLGNQTKPWFLWLAYTAPHSPFHLPPLDLHDRDNLPSDQASVDANPLPYYFAMLEAMDTEMARLLNSLNEEALENTVIIFIGDNGTPRNTSQEYAAARVKGSVYQGGVNVPMIVSGKNVTRVNEIENALINTTDLFATIANLTGVGISQINDSSSFVNLLQGSAPVRDYAYAEIGYDSGGSDTAIRNETHKYILFEDGSEALYDLSENPLENPNLLNANQLPISAENEAQLNSLKEELNNIKSASN